MPATYLWLRQLLAQLLPELENLPAGPQGAARAQAWFKRLLARFEARGLTTPAQQKNRVVDARHAIRLRFGADHPALAFVGFDEATWQAINLPTHDRTEARNEHQRLLRHPEKIVARAAQLLQSPRFEDLAVGLGATTGRRMSELLDGHARLEPATPWSVRFTGQRKHKGDREDFAFEIPTLAPAADVLAAWARLQVMLGKERLSPQEINNRYGHQVNAAADRHFRGLVPPRLPRPPKGQGGGLEDPHARQRAGDALYLHLFRAVYATIAVHWFCPPRVNRLVFKAEIQGHRQILAAQGRLRRAYTASRHYDDYQVADATGENLDGRQGIMLGKLPGLEVLGVFQAPPKDQETPKPAKVASLPGLASQEEAAEVDLPPAPQPPGPLPAPAPAPTTPPMDPAPAPATLDAAPPVREDTAPPTDPAPARQDAGGDAPEAPKEKKPRPVTYRVYPADRPRLDAFRAEPKQSQADNLQGVLARAEAAAQAIQAQEQTQAQLQEALAQAEQMAQERDQARQEAREGAARLPDLEGEVQRLQKALEGAQAQAGAAAQAGQAAAGAGSPVALAVLARELLGLATGDGCPAELQGRLIALATQALGGGGGHGGSGATNQGKRQVAGGEPRDVGEAKARGSAGQGGKVTAAVADQARFGPLFATGHGVGTQPPITDDGAQEQPDTPAKTAAANAPPPVGESANHDTPEQSTEEPAAGGAGNPLAPPTAAPRTFTRKGGAAEKLAQALRAVVAHNDAQTSRERKWAVTESALARLTGCFRPAVRGFFATRVEEIAAHNQRHHLSGGHNAARGKRGEQIEAEVDWRGQAAPTAPAAPAAPAA